MENVDDLRSPTLIVGDSLCDCQAHDVGFKVSCH